LTKVTAILAVLREQLQELAGQPVDEVVPELCGERSRCM
jgi:hypothetical protein